MWIYGVSPIVEPDTAVAVDLKEDVLEGRFVDHRALRVDETRSRIPDLERKSGNNSRRNKTTRIPFNLRSPPYA